MAERRMFSKQIIDSDTFLDMPLSAQSLYFHFAMRADDDGFVNNPRKLQRMVGSCDDDFKILVAKGFVASFESGVVAIIHWRVHNYVPKDRYKPTIYQAEKALLEAASEGVDTNCIQIDDSLGTQVRLGKDRIDKVRLVEDSIGESREGKDCDYDKEEEKLQDFDNVFLTEEQLEDLLDKMGIEVFDEYIKRLRHFIKTKGAFVRSHYETILKWYNEDRRVKT